MSKAIINTATLAAKRAQHSSFAIKAVMDSFENAPKNKDSDPVLYTGWSLVNDAITLTQVSGQVSCTWKGRKMRHLPLTMTDAREWVAIEILEEIAELDRVVRNARMVLNAKINRVMRTVA